VTADPALSSDGAMLAYASDRSGMNNLDIWVQQTAGSQPLQLTRDLVDELEPSFSPDGSALSIAPNATAAASTLCRRLAGRSRGCSLPVAAGLVFLLMVSSLPTGLAPTSDLTPTPAAIARLSFLSAAVTHAR
jgi:hypothetical protein